MNIEPKSKHDKAIVIGGSMAGMLAARVLADHYREVLVLERDDLAAEGNHRRGVPHGRHAHALLAGGLQVIEDLFPRISDELVTDGALECDPLNDGRWFFEGNDLVRSHSGTTAIMLSRPMLERGVRRRVRMLANVTILDKQSARNLLARNGRVIGVQTDDSSFEGDLIVDTSGRGSQAPKWLEGLGFKRPEQEIVDVQVTYTTRLFQRRPQHMNGDLFATISPTPDVTRGGVVLSKENDEWIVTLYGYFGERAPEDLDGFIEFAGTLPAMHIHDLVRTAEPIGDATVFRFPGSSRRRYENVDRHPDGFLAFGDSICSFNPIYGQGMSSAALQAGALDVALREGTEDLPRRFYTRAAKVIDSPWSVAVGSDLKIPKTEGKRSLQVRFINWYMGKLHRHGHRSVDSALTFVRVAQLLDPPTSIMRPAIAVRVLAAALLRTLGLTRVLDRGEGEIAPSGEWRSDGF